MERREFLKWTGALAVAATSGTPMILLGGCGGSGGYTIPASSEKIAFKGQDYLDNIRKIISNNGYKFSVDNNTPYNECGYPGAPPFRDVIDNSADNYPYPKPLANLTYDRAILPSSFDIRNVDGHCYIGPIRNQQDTYMCWAFAASDVASVAYNLKNGLYGGNCIELSPMYLCWVSANSGNANDVNALNLLTKFGDPEYHGACREIDFPFSDYEDHAISNFKPPNFIVDKAKKSPLITLRRCGRIFPTNYSDTTTYIKMAILKYGAVTTGIAVDSAVLAYTSGVFENTIIKPNQDPYYTCSGHAISLIGWDDNPPEGGGGCWIMRNSWGTSWGENGYMRIRYFSAYINTNACFIEASPTSGDDDFHISGNITIDKINASGVTLTLSGDDNFTVGSNSGNYIFQALTPGQYRVEPSYVGVAFSPPYRDIAINQGSSQENIDFAGSKV